MILRIFVMLGVYSTVRAEVVMRETRIDPFTFLFEKQNLLIEKMDSVLERMESLEITNKQHMSDILKRVEKTDTKVDEITHAVLTMRDTLELVHSNSKTDTNPVQKDDPQIVNCNCGSDAKQTEPEVQPKLDDPSINSLLFSDIYDDAPDYPESPTNESCISNTKFNHALSKLSKSVLSGFNVTLKAHASSILSKMITKMDHDYSSTQKYFENFVKNQLNTLRGSLSHQMKIIDQNIQQQKMSFIEITKYLLNLNQTGDTRAEFDWKDPLNVTKDPEVLNDADMQNSTVVDTDDAVTTTETVSMTGLLSTISNLWTANKTPSPLQVLTTEKPLPIHPCINCQNMKFEEKDDDTVIHKISNEIHELEEKLSSRIEKTEEQITGFKIYQSSAFYSQMKEIRYELSKVKDDLSLATESTGSKLGRKLDSNKLSLFTFIDAAVTSITSSAVTSSQATGMAIAKTLRNIFHHLHLQMKEVSWYGTPDCPGMYQKFGSKCLLMLPSVTTTWSEACHLCSSLGGRVPTTDMEADMQLLQKVMQPTSSGFWMRPFNSSEDGCGVVDEKIAELPIDRSIDDCESYYTNGTGLASSPCTMKLSVLCHHNHMKCNNGDVMNRKFNVTNAVSDLDYFLRNSKYFKF